MIVIRVELWSAITGKKTEIARMQIANKGGKQGRLHGYFGKTFRGRSTTALDKEVVLRTGEVDNYPREAYHVWNLVARMLKSMGYTN